MNRKALLVGVVFITACTSPAATDDTAFVVTPDVQAELTVEAISVACRDLCLEQPLYVRDQLVDTDTLTIEEDPMPEKIRQAIARVFPDVTWVDESGVAAILDDVESGRAVLVSVSSLRDLASDVRGIEVGISQQAFHGQIVQFRWDETAWSQMDGEDTGVTVTSVVS